MTSRRLHHRVYVVLLDPAVLGRFRFRRDNPGHRPGMPCLYVGMTGLTPAQRFANHIAGKKASRWVAGFGVRLAPEHYAHLPAMSYAEAAKAEELLARRLRLAGYAVAQG